MLGATSKPQGELQLCEAWTSTRVHESAKAGKFMSAGTEVPQFHRKNHVAGCKSICIKKLLKMTTQRKMDVSKNRGIPKWMVYNGKPY